MFPDIQTAMAALQLGGVTLGRCPVCGRAHTLFGPADPGGDDIDDYKTAPGKPQISICGWKEPHLALTARVWYDSNGVQAWTEPSGMASRRRAKRAKRTEKP